MSPYFWTQIPGLPLFASTVRNLGTLIIFTSNIMRRATLRSLNAAFKAQCSTPILSGQSVVRAGPSYASTAPGSVRCFHITPRSLQSISLSSTTTSYPSSHDKVAPVDTPYFVDNKFLSSSTKSYVDLHDPATNDLVTRIPENTDAEMTAAVDSAEKAFKEWSQTSVLKRQQIMFRFVQLIRENYERLAASCTIEQGKTLADARGDVLRGLQVAEAAVAAPEFLKGELLEVSKDMETRTYREPLGVVSAICPFSKFLNRRISSDL
jgi:malonate-semialdehyde dehydrogenase (acetylating)/methylmalonate-semialdehyde dehydrogenase